MLVTNSAAKVAWRANVRTAIWTDMEPMERPAAPNALAANRNGMNIGGSLGWGLRDAGLVTGDRMKKAPEAGWPEGL